MLVVEDADAVRVLTGRILYAAGYQVVSVESGAVALERLDTCDVLVTDVVMPGMSGVELVVTGPRAPPRAAGHLRLGLHRRCDHRRVRRPEDRVPGEAVRRRRPAARRAHHARRRPRQAQALTPGALVPGGQPAAPAGPPPIPRGRRTAAGEGGGQLAAPANLVPRGSRDRYVRTVKGVFGNSR